MRLRRLEIEALAGIEPGFVLDRAGPGLNVVIGPNGSGKSSIGRSLRALLGPLAPEVAGAPIHLVADFEDGSSRLRAVRSGAQLVWERDGERLEHGPPLPEPRLLGCFTVDADALTPAGSATEAEIGVRLARALAGGYDLAAVRSLFAARPRRAAADRLALRKAETALAESRARYERIRRDEARLAGLREALAEADAAAAEAEHCARAVRLIEARVDLAESRARLAAYPEGMERLAGDEGERLDALAERGDALAARRAQADAAAEEAAGVLARHRHLEVDAAGLNAALRAVAALEEHERAHEAQARAVAAADAACDEARAALGADAPGDGLRVDRAAVARAEAALERVRAAAAERSAAQALLEALPEPGPGEEPERLREARGELLRWLAAPDPLAPRIGWLLAGAIATLGALAVPLLAAGPGVVSAVLLAAPPTALREALLSARPDALGAGLLATLLVLLGAALALALRAVRDGESRRAIRARYERILEAQPRAWKEREVREALGALDRALREALESERAAARRAEAGARLARLEAREEAVREEIASELAPLGFDALSLDASAPRWLALAAQWDRARAAAVEARAVLAERAEQRDRCSAQIRAFIAQALEDGAGTTAAWLAASVARIGEAIDARDRAAAALAEARRELARLDVEDAEIRRARAALLERAGVEEGESGVAALRERLAELKTWRLHNAGLQDDVAVEGDRAAALRELGAPDEALTGALAAGDVEAIRARQADALERARDRDARSQQIGRIEAEIAAASAGRVLEQARADVESARAALAGAREALLDAEAGTSIVDLVERDHVATARPEVLARAASLFARFTRHQLSLGFDAGTGSFTAHDNIAGVTRAVDALSSGTRMQLMLAVRLAFAREVEPGGPLPLLLDEVLATADPERHHAVATAVATIVAEEGRQVFYLSARPEDARLWAERTGAEVVVHDLVQIRGAGRFVDRRAPLVPPARPAVPAPRGRDVAAYAAAIGALRDDPWLPAESVHPLHLLHDDLPLLHRLLVAGVASAGALRALLGADAATLHLEPGEIARLSWRLRVLEAYRQVWREGRGRPLRRADLAEAPSIGPTFLEPVCALLEDCGGDAQALVTALESGAVKRFRKDKLEALRVWLREGRHLDPRPVLDALERALRVEGLLRDVIETGEASIASVREVIGWLDAAREIGVPREPAAAPDARSPALAQS